MGQVRCHCCKNSVVVIMIYDECYAAYIDGSLYSADKAYWDALIDDEAIARKLYGRVRAGLMVPTRGPWGPGATSGLGNIVPAGQVLPKGGEASLPNGSMPYAELPDRTGATRVLATEIVQFFNAVSAVQGGYPDSAPDYLQLVLDNSGSIYVGEYRTELDAALAQLAAAWPAMQIRTTLTVFPERPFQFARDAISPSLTQ